VGTPLKEQKRVYLRDAVERLKRSGLTQRVIAERMGEDEGPLSGKIKGTRGITDEYIDRFAQEFDMPYSFGEIKDEGVSREQFDRLLLKADAQASLLLELVAEVRRSRGQ
jgi:transcriptional regulator with XRE-family HTH domain